MPQRVTLNHLENVKPLDMGTSAANQTSAGSSAPLASPMLLNLTISIDMFDLKRHKTGQSNGKHFDFHLNDFQTFFYFQV